jgi:hypothetical protein
VTDQDDYSPDSLRFWLTGKCPRCRWSMLESAVEGGTGSLSGSGSGRGGRLGLANLKADMEHAADQLPLFWSVTTVIYRKQHRESALQSRRSMASAFETHLGDLEHPDHAVALSDALWRMAVSLGWMEGKAA